MLQEVPNQMRGDQGPKTSSEKREERFIIPDGHVLVPVGLYMAMVRCYFAGGPRDARAPQGGERDAPPDRRAAEMQLELGERQVTRVARGWRGDVVGQNPFAGGQ